ncbi:Long-chain-fatty-acid--CoA ligase [Frankia canadensis]|uniref:Long-chain-fatty-acid--CoA ligase n=1 Tax=Frankia canadensis TaxID=1836972 RepID=A0A2I2KVY2_9ACTN|nr:long-chain fatty acid--CoA ligase [Frankia canadensis]SNQ49821.1 Long-chain-fatty-acid--CoA ligase [Frankia canadensis]SOU57111.1 Long-chain-fatty-acid--CoA ligase [Frankia canadensis]
MLNLAVVLESTARDLPDRDAVVLGGRRLTYARLNAAASRVAAALAALGIGPGDRVALACPNLPDFPIVYYGILKAGATIVPLSVLLTRAEIVYHLENSAARALFCFEGTGASPLGESGFAAFTAVPGCELFVLITGDPLRDLAGADAGGPGGDAAGGAAGPSGGPAAIGDPGRAGWPTLAAFVREASADPAFETVVTREDDIAVVLYTSGTTGRPKGAQLTHSNMVLNAQVCTRVFQAAAHDAHLVCLPLFHSFGQTVHLNAGLLSGATLHLLPRFEPEAALATMERAAITFFAGVPTMYWALLRQVSSAEDQDMARIAGNLRISVCGGAPMPAELLRDVEHRFGVAIVEGYGLSETSPVSTFNRLDRPRRIGSVGLPVWGVEVRIVRDDGAPARVGEAGEILIRGHNVMRSYLDDPAGTAEAIDARGWFHTGDIGRLDAEGYLYLVDRIKEMIIRGGFNVYPREVEEVLLTHPGISLAAVVGVPHESHGQEVKAFVVRRPGATETEEDIVAWCRRTMAGHKYPRLVEFRDQLPMTAAGKVLKRALVTPPSAPPGG